MKTFIVNKTAELIETVTRTIFTVQVIGLGLFMSFLFVLGITYNTTNQSPVNDTHINVPSRSITNNNTAELIKNLPDQNG